MVKKYLTLAITFLSFTFQILLLIERNLLILRSVLLFDWDSLVVNFKNDTEKLFPSIYNKVNKIVKKHVPLTS